MPCAAPATGVGEVQEEEAAAARRVPASTRQPVAHPGPHRTAPAPAARVHAPSVAPQPAAPRGPGRSRQRPGRLSHRHGRERGERRPPGRAGQCGRRRPRRAQDHEGHGEDAEREGGVRCAREQLGPAGEVPGRAAAVSPGGGQGGVGEARPGGGPAGFRCGSSAGPGRAGRAAWAGLRRGRRAPGLGTLLLTKEPGAGGRLGAGGARPSLGLGGGSLFYLLASRRGLGVRGTWRLSSQL